MQRRMSLALPALLTSTLCVCFSASTGAVADDCLAGPNAPSPPGMHWYYHVDRATQRQCWYLGAEGARVRVHTQQASAAARPAAAPAKTSKQAPPMPPLQATTSAETAPDAGALPSAALAFAASPSKQADNADKPPPRAAAPARPAPARVANAANVAAAPADAATSEPSLGQEQPTPAQEASQEQPAPAPEDDMPLIWPVLTPDELAAADQPAASSAFSHLAGVFAAVMAMAALIGMVLLRISTRRRPRRFPAENRADAHSGAGQRAPWHQALADNESSLMPDAAAEWQGAPDYEDEGTVPELLRQLQWQRRQYDLNGALLSPGR